MESHMMSQMSSTDVPWMDRVCLQLLAYPDALRDLDECLKTFRRVYAKSHVLL